MFDFHSFLLGLQLSSLSFFFIFLVFNSFWFNSWSSFWFNWFCSFIFMIWLSSICFLFEIIIRFLLQSSIWIRLALLLRDCFWMYLSNFDGLLFDLDRFYSFFFFHGGSKKQSFRQASLSSMFVKFQFFCDVLCLLFEFANFVWDHIDALMLWDDYCDAAARNHQENTASCFASRATTLSSSRTSWPKANSKQATKARCSTCTALKYNW